MQYRGGGSFHQIMAHVSVQVEKHHNRRGGKGGKQGRTSPERSKLQRPLAQRRCRSTKLPQEVEGGAGREGSGDQHAHALLSCSKCAVMSTGAPIFTRHRDCPNNCRTLAASQRRCTELWRGSGARWREAWPIQGRRQSISPATWRARAGGSLAGPTGTHAHPDLAPSEQPAMRAAGHALLSANLPQRQAPASFHSLHHLKLCTSWPQSQAQQPASRAPYRSLRLSSPTWTQDCGAGDHGQ